MRVAPYQVGFAPTFSFALGKMDKALIIECVESIARPVVEACGLELVHIDIAGIKHDMVVRIYIDKEGGITLDDCAVASQRIDDVLDDEDLIPGSYVLEVSSPGIERELYSLADFVRFSGQLAKVRIKDPIDGQKTFVGHIAGVSGEEITIDDRTKGNVSFDHRDVDKANLKIDLSKEFHGR